MAKPLHSDPAQKARFYVRLNILISPEKIRERLEAWELPKNKVEKGYLAIYSRLAKSAEKGAALNYKGG